MASSRSPEGGSHEPPNEGRPAPAAKAASQGDSAATTKAMTKTDGTSSAAPKAAPKADLVDGGAAKSMSKTDGPAATAK